MSKDKYSRKFCVAPMMGYTTPHARKLYRILSQKTFLFTEMIAASTMLHSKTKDLIIENDLQNPNSFHKSKDNDSSPEKEDIQE